MNRSTNRQPSHGDVARGFCVFILLVGLCGVAFASGPASPEKLARQIGTMERTIDRALVDSPNFLVTSGRNACGFYLADLGAVFTFNAQLTDDWSWGNGNWFFGPGSHISVRDDDGERQIIIRKNHGRSWSIKKLVGDEDDDDEDVIFDTVKLYERGKEELIELLMDEGENLSVPSGEYVMIAARMNDDDLKHEKKISRLTLKAKIDDLKAYGDDKLSETEMKSRIVIEEN